MLPIPTLSKSLRHLALTIATICALVTLFSAQVGAQALHLTYDDECNSLSISNQGLYGDSGPKHPGRYDATYHTFASRHLLTGEQQEFVDPDLWGLPKPSSQSLGLNPFSVKQGILTITADAAPPQDYPYLEDQKYYSGVLTTYSTFSQTYGYFEMRAKLPQGPGLWPAFWMLPTTLDKNGNLNWQNEIDVLEAFGQRTKSPEGGSNQVHWALHGMAKNDPNLKADVSEGGWATVPGNIYTGYHTYGVDWEPYPGNITYYFDDVQIGQTPTLKDMDQPMFMIACMALGGSWLGPVDPASGEFPAHMQIDYIRAYSRDPTAKEIKPEHGYSPSPAVKLLNSAAKAKSLPSLSRKTKDNPRRRRTC